MATWKLQELRELVKGRFTEIQYTKANRLINSIDWKINATYYHCFQAVDVMRPYFEHEQFDTTHAMRLAFESTDESKKFNQAISIREYNLVAAATTAHSTPEIIAQLAALLFFDVEPNVRNVTLKKAIERLPGGDLKLALAAIMESSEYQYLSAFTNTVKHISLVSPQYHISFEDPEYHGVQFMPFSLGPDTFPEKRDTDLLRELSLLKKWYVEAGIRINSALRQQFAQVGHSVRPR